MGVAYSKGLKKAKVDEATSNTSLSNARYVLPPDKHTWNVFKKKTPIIYPVKTLGGKNCVCGNSGQCKTVVTPNGVTIHYPQKKKKFAAFYNERYKPPKYVNAVSSKPLPKVQIIRPRKFPTLRLDNFENLRPYRLSSYLKKNVKKTLW